MKNLWNEQAAKQAASENNLGLRVYSSNLLGQAPDLVLHGGGNTSVKGSLQNVFGDSERVLFVKGSGWDLRTIEAAGFPPVKLEYLLRLGELEKLSDSEMMRQLRLALLDPTAPTPSVEAILHALIPHKYVDHSHADAVVAISNSPDGEARLGDIYGDEVLVLPYIMPGFILARQVAQASEGLDWSKLRGIVLLHHGIFTFAEDAKTSYDNMIELVSKAEAHLEQVVAQQSPQQEASNALAESVYQATNEDCLQLSALRNLAARAFAGPMLLTLDSSKQATGFACLSNCDELVTRGPLTPDHTIHTKAFAAIFEAEDLSQGLQNFEDYYRSYFKTHSKEHHLCLDPMPRYGVWRNKGMIYLAASNKRLQIVQDICRHTIKAMQWGEALGGWQALPRQDLFDVEYWELEQAKLASSGTRAEFEGKVAVVTGAASGIGAACVEEFLSRGAVVLALDIAQGIETQFEHPAVLAIHCDVTNNESIAGALQRGVLAFGGLDVLVSNAGYFPASQTLEAMEDASWDQSLQLNLSAHMRVLRACVPFLKNGFDPAVVFVASKNVPAPGPGAAAYSAAKAGLTQLARVAALELGEKGIRVNTVHPNAVYDTGIWTEEVLAQRAAHYGLSMEEYKTSNVLKAEVSSADVANAIVLLSGTQLSKTTGTQLPVDGGNERVI